MFNLLPSDNTNHNEFSDAFSEESAKELYEKLLRYRGNSGHLQIELLQNIYALSKGQYAIANPTNAVMFLLGAMTMTASASVHETRLATYKMYPSLAADENDLYTHMCDVDYIQRFSQPATADFTFIIQYNSLITTMVYEESSDCMRATIPRDTKITIDHTAYTLAQPIDIRHYANNIIKVSYDNTYPSEISELSTNILTSQLIEDANEEKYVLFHLPLLQYEIISTTATISFTDNFKRTIEYTNQYYFGKVYHQDPTTREWLPIKVIHTDEIYDLRTPTAVFKVFEGYVEVHIPLPYLMNKKIHSNIRIDIYTTQGNIKRSYADRLQDDFTCELKPIDVLRDTTPYTNAFAQCSYRVFSSDRTKGGRNRLSFEALREKVINNTIGPIDTPIHPLHYQERVGRLGYDLLKEVDNITDRFYVATSLVEDSGHENILTPVNVALLTITLDSMITSELSNFVIHASRITILPEQIYQSKNYITTPISDKKALEFDTLRAPEKIKMINAGDYYVTPFHFVIDYTNQILSLHPYYLKEPSVDKINFKDQNHTTSLTVNTQYAEIVKHKHQYVLKIYTMSGDLYKGLSNNDLSILIRFNKTDDVLAYTYLHVQDIETLPTEEKCFTFTLDTDHDINDTHNIRILNTQTAPDVAKEKYVPLTIDVDLYYLVKSTPVNYLRTIMDAEIEPFISRNVVTKETLTIKLGDYYEYYYRNIREINPQGHIRRYPDDVYWVRQQNQYEKDDSGNIFNIDRENCELDFKLIGRAGTVVRDEDGVPIIRHRKGDPMLDSDGNPIKDPSVVNDYYLTFNLYDASFRYANTPYHYNYIDNHLNSLRKTVLTDLPEINNFNLEKTTTHYRSKQTKGMLYGSNTASERGAYTIEREYHLIFYVVSAVYEDSKLKTTIQNNAIGVINDLFKASIHAKNELEQHIATYMKTSVVKCVVEPLNMDLENLMSYDRNDYTISLKKRLRTDDNRSIYSEECVDFTFVKYVE